MKLSHIYKDKNLLATALLFIVLCVILLLKADYYVHDFANYYYGAQTVFNEAIDIYDPWEFNSFIAASGQEHVFANYAPHPPITRYFFIPFTILNVIPAKIIFNLIGIVFISLSVYQLSKSLRINSNILLLFPLIFLTPLLYNIQYGQSYLFLISFLIQAYLLTEKQKWIAASLCLSAAIVLKFTPLILILYFLINRKYRIVIYSLIFISILIILDAAINGLTMWHIFHSEVLPRASDGLINATYSPMHHSVNAFFKSLFILDADYNPSPLLGADYLYYFFNYFFLFSLLFAAIVSSIKKQSFLSFSFWILLLYFLPSIGSTYSGIIMIVPFLALFNGLTERMKYMGIILIFLICNPLFKTFISPEISLAIFVALGIALIFFYFLQLKINIPMILLFAFLLSAPTMIKSFPSSEGKSLISKNDTRIVNEINLKGDEIIVTSFGREGFRKESLSLGTVLSAESVEEKARSGIMVNDSIFYFLSDARHGYHFYQLKKLELSE